jgi:CYTH domain-containing protein
MPGDVESIGAESGVTDMDKIDEIQQLTKWLGVEQATGDAKYMNDSSSD